MEGAYMGRQEDVRMDAWVERARSIRLKDCLYQYRAHDRCRARLPPRSRALAGLSM